MSKLSFDPPEAVSEDALASDGAATGEDTPESTPQVSIHSIVWSVVLSVAVLVVIGVFTFELEPFRQMLGQLNPWPLAAALATVGLRVFFGGLRLKYVSHGRLRLLGGLRSQLAWDFFANITPSAIGGGPFAIAYIARDSRLPVGEASAIILFSMLLDQVWFAVLIPVILIGGLFLNIIPTSLGAVGAWTLTAYYLGFMGWVTIFGYSTFFRPQLLEKFVDRVFRLKGLRRFRKRALKEMAEHRHRARILRSQRLMFFVKSFLISFLPWLCRYLLVVFIIWSVFPGLDKVIIFLRTIALHVGAVGLPTPGGAGGLEGLYVLFFGPPIMPEPLVAPTLLTWRLLGYYIFVALGGYLTIHQVHKSIRRKKRAQALAADPSANGASAVPTPESVGRAE